MLLVALRSDDEQAFREIYDRYWKLLYAIARRKIESQDVVEELVQDVFLNLWERRYVIRIQKLDAYLTTAVRYEIINHIKSTIVHDKYLNNNLLYHSEAVNTTNEQIDLDDLINRVNQLLNDLPEKTRQIFRLNRLEYKSVKEIASLLQIPQRTVEHHLSQAVKLLRILLQDFLSILVAIFSCNYFKDN